MSSAPHAPWPLQGEAVLGLARWQGAGRVPLPSGLSAVPGRWLVGASRYTSSPVGPYLELIVGRPARLGRRLGWCIVHHVVDSQAARVGGALNWGFPSEEQPGLEWVVDGASRGIRWVDRGWWVTGRPTRLVLPVALRLRALQRRSDGPVSVPTSGRGMGRLARITVEVKEDDALAGLAGSHLGATVGSWNLRLDPARQPVGLFLLRAPLRAPATQVWCETEAPPAPSRPMVVTSGG